MSDKILKLSQAQTLYQDLRERIDALPTDNDIPEVPVQDVQVNGASILNNRIANIPFGGNETTATILPAGVVRAKNGTNGIYIDANGYLKVSMAGPPYYKNGTESGKPIAPAYQHYAVFYGLSKVAGADLKNVSDVTFGTYPDISKAAIQNMLGITDLISTEESSTATAAHALNSTFMMNGKLHRATAAIAIGDAVEVGTNCEVVKADEVFVKNTDIASSSTYGIVKIGSGLGLSTQNSLVVQPASTTQIKTGTVENNPITPVRQDVSVFYGLSKLAGVDLKNETVTVGIYPETSKTAIRSLIGAAAASDVTVTDVQVNGSSIVNNGVANIPQASGSNLGAVKIQDGTHGLRIYHDSGNIGTFLAQSAEVKAGTNVYKPIVPYMQHESVFYGLAKVAGVDMASSDNAIGTYTETAKSAIRSMLGIETKITLIETISSTTPSIIGQPNVRYNCGEVSTINITPPANGTIDVFFTSGSTAAVLTVPNTVKFPSWFDVNTLDSNTIYELMITDAIYGSVMVWES